MLTSVVAILTGRSKIKVTTLLSVLALLLLDDYEILEIPESDIGGWFKYGLEISFLALSISILVDVFSLSMEAMRSSRNKAKELQREQDLAFNKLLGNLAALSEVEVFFLVYIKETFENEIKVSISFEGYALDTLKSLYEQGMFVEVGGTKRKPRWVIPEVVLESISQLNLDQYDGENEKYLWQYEDAINDVVEPARV